MLVTSGRRPVSVLAGQAIAVVLAGGCGSSGSSKQDVDAGMTDATSSSSSGGSGSGSASTPDGSGSDGGSDGGDSGPAPSCAPGGPGMTNCGSASESCCTSLEVAGGTYYRTYNTKDSTSGRPDGGWPDLADPATVSGFRLDKYLVTVGRFRQFVNAVYPDGDAGPTGWLPVAGSGIHKHLNGGLGLVSAGATSADGGVVYETGWDALDWNSQVTPTNANLMCDAAYQTWTNTASTQENLPINCVSWYEAYAFCIWDGGFLPSEPEWEYAAAGGSQQREYPWGSAEPGTANLYAIYDCYYGSGGEAGMCSGVANIAAVGMASLGAGLSGQLDLAGNMWQWNLDWFESPYTECTDCAELAATATCAAPPCSTGGPSFRVFRGGAFNYPVSALLPPTRYGNPPMTRNQTLGFRCAGSP
jgi:sulfatase modifying factor 1